MGQPTRKPFPFALGAAATAVVSFAVGWLQVRFPVVSGDPLAFAVPFGLTALLAALAGWRAVAGAAVGVAAAVAVAGFTAAEAALGGLLTAAVSAPVAALRRYAPLPDSSRSSAISHLILLALAVAFLRGAVTTLLWTLSGLPDPVGGGLAAGVVEWFAAAFVAPAVFLWWRRRPAVPSANRAAEFVALLVLTGAAAQGLFGGGPPTAASLPFLLLSGLVVLCGWAALRFNGHGAAAVTAVMFVVLVGNAVLRGLGQPAAPGPLVPAQVEFLAALGVLAAVLHYLAAVVGDRAGTATEIGRLHHELSAQHAHLREQAVESERKTAFLEAVLSQLPAGVMIVGPDGRILQRNERHRQMFPTGAAEAIHDLPHGRLSTTTVRNVPYEEWPIVRALRDGRVTEGLSARLHRTGDDGLDVHISATPVLGAGGEVLGAVSVLSDVSERNRVLRRLRESELQLRLTLQSARMMVAEWATADGAFRAPEALAVWFRLPAGTRFRAVADLMPFIHPEDAGMMTDKIAALMAGNSRCESLFRVYDLDGRLSWVLTRSLAMTDEAGRPTGWVSTVLVDVTERYRQLDQLRLLESAVVHARDAVVILEHQAKAGGGRCVLYANRAFAQMSGYATEEVIGRSLHFLRGPDSDQATLDRLRDALDARRPYQCELLNYRKDGTQFWVELSVVPVPDAAGNCSHWVMIQRDASDRKRAEAELRHSQAMLAEAQRIAHLGSWEYTPASGEVVWSDEKYRIFGHDPRAVTPSVELYLAAVHPDDLTRMRQTLTDDLRASAAPTRTLDLRIVRPDGEVRHITEQYMIDRDDAGRPVRFRGVTQDVTERRHAQLQLIQAQKMELIGQMAGGIAHDFNNVLTGVIGNLDLIALPPDDPNRRLIDTATRAALRATDMTKKLLGFARKSPLRSAPVALGPIVTEVVEFAGRTTGPRIELRPAVHTAAKVDGDFTLLSQVLLNLCLNARDAMPHGGRIDIRVDEVTVPDGAAVGRPGEFVRVTVEDNGSGMTPEVRAKVFEPFFTTKPVGEGTGLGLAMVHGIVEQHDGWVECTSEVGRGTRFDLYLPRTRSRAEDILLTPPPIGDRAMPALTPPPHRANATKTILLVDDEDMIRELARTVLEVKGYQVLEACDGEEAIEVFQTRRRDIDLVILDLTMPRLSGQDTFRALVGIDPNAQVLFSSGYSSDTLEDTEGALGLLPKPYRPNDLLTAVRAAVGDHPITAG